MLTSLRLIAIWALTQTTFLIANSPIPSQITVGQTISGAVTGNYTNKVSLDFPNVVASCTTLTMPVVGAVDGFVVALGIPAAAIIAGSTYSSWVSAPGVVSIKHCCLTTCDPPPAKFLAIVTGY